jgi:adenosylcobinamide kinase/adenosylcobinamide-phosphate guanylyltransferase
LKNTLILGGARSGKSQFAQEMARKNGGQVLFVATASAGDEEMQRRIKKHREERPYDWRTLEAGTDIGPRINRDIGRAQTVIVDCVTLLVSNIIGRHADENDDAVIEAEIMAEIEDLIGCFDDADVGFIIVSNEVGLGLVPADRISRLYRDLLGRSNQRLAQRVDEVYLMVAGIPVAIKKGEGRREP